MLDTFDHKCTHYIKCVVTRHIMQCNVNTIIRPGLEFTLLLSKELVICYQTLWAVENGFKDSWTVGSSICFATTEG